MYPIIKIQKSVSRIFYSAWLVQVLFYQLKRSNFGIFADGQTSQRALWWCEKVKNNLFGPLIFSDISRILGTVIFSSKNVISDFHLESRKLFWENYPISMAAFSFLFWFVWFSAFLIFIKIFAAGKIKKMNLKAQRDPLARQKITNVKFWTKLIMIQSNLSNRMIHIQIIFAIMHFLDGLLCTIYPLIVWSHKESVSSFFHNFAYRYSKK